MKLKSLVSIMKKNRSFFMPSKEGVISIDTEITKNSFPKVKYNECTTCGHLWPTCKVLGINTMNNIIMIPNSCKIFFSALLF